MKSNFDYKALGERIREIRKSRGLTQERLAEKCDLSTAHIGHIERGTRALSIESLITISEFLNVSIDYLLLGVSAASNKNIEKVLQSVDKADESKINTLYNIVKILSENINEL